jgi:L-malate glycosyltransferase
MPALQPAAGARVAGAAARPAPVAPPLRVAFCIDNMNVGGTELNAVRTAAHLVRRGVELRVFSLSTEGPLLERYAALGVPVHFLPISSLYGWSALRRGRELAALVRQHGVQVVHAHDFYSNIFAGPWARLAGAAFIASRRWWEGPDRRLQRWANRLGYVLADRVLANSPGVAGLLVRGERVSPQSVVVVPNFLDEEAFEAPPTGWVDAFAAELQLPHERLVVGVVASLQPIKDHGTLLRAIANLAPRWPALHVVLVGADAGSRGELEALVAELDIAARVRFAGVRASVPSPHHLFDISALTSVSEGLPNSLLEAMAAGKPVVATAVGAVPDIVEHRRTGLLVAPRAPQELAAALDALLASPVLREQYGDAGRRRARTRHGVDAALHPLLDAYRHAARPRLQGGAP